MKKLITILTVLFLLVSCNTNKKEEEQSNTDYDGKVYIDKLVSFKAREKNINNQTDNPEFDAFLDKVFVEGMEADFLAMHFEVIDYKKYGITKPPVDLGEIKYEMDVENFNYMKDQLDELLSFDYDTLSYRQQYDYEALEYSIYETLADYCYYKYNFVFGMGNNFAEDIITNFTDYTFYDQESLDDYLTCLEDFDRFIDDALAYTEAQSNDGHPLLDEWIDYTKDVCTGVLNKTDDNAFIVTFDKRVNGLDFLSDEEKKEYCEKNKKIVLEEILPTYQLISETLEKYRGKAKIDDYALYKLDKNYAQLEYMLKGSNNYSIDEVFEKLGDTLSYLEAEYISCAYDEASFKKLEDAIDGKYANLELVGRDCLDFLSQNLSAYYPDLGVVDYDVETLDPDTAPSTAIAYYWQSPIDNHNQNIIRTNPNNMVEGFKTYGTLSHEGFPGHLYQHVFYQKMNPHNFRRVIGFIGYTEGWAVNAQYYAYRYSGVEDDYAASALFFEDAYYFIVYSIIDIAVNYYGYTPKQITEYFKNESRLLNFNDEISKYYHDFLIQMPGTYCSYGIGLVNFMDMCLNTKAELGDKFDYPSYHQVLMENGPLPFNILQQAVDNYIAANK